MGYSSHKRIMESSINSLNQEEVRPYRIHVSSKYLDLTRKKLELTRLPHELLLPSEREWEGTRKAEIEPLIDFWLESYSFRGRESHLNSFPQYRTAISTPLSPHPLRIHFIHLRSSSPSAIPLLLLPSFPLTNLSLTALLTPLVSPSSTSLQAFHIVIPSFPGLGFSDALKSDEKVLETTAGIVDELMKRVGYEVYICSATGSGNGMRGVDYHLARLVGEKEGCVGLHVIDPCISKPIFRTDFWGWIQLRLASFFKATVWGYEAVDWSALRTEERKRTEREISREITHTGKNNTHYAKGSLSTLGLYQPNTLSYALCDSPIGLLSLICSSLRHTSPSHTLSPTQIVDLTTLAWLPGPEAGMRFWSQAVGEIEELKTRKEGRMIVGVTVFGADGMGEVDDEDEEGGTGYIPPAWVARKHDVLFSQRVKGAPGLLLWERPDVLIEGIRGFGVEIGKVDKRLFLKGLEEVVVEEGIIEESEGEDDGDGEYEGHGMQLDVESPDTVIAEEVS